VTFWGLSAIDAAAEIWAGRVASTALVGGCLERIKETDDAIGAWAFLDPDLVLEQAAAMDELRRAGRPIGPLHGVPVAVSDVFDAEAMPSACKFDQRSDRRDQPDAAVVEKLREAGAVIMGKLKSSNIGCAGVTATQNPHDGKIAAGAAGAAAVAAGHVPLAIGDPADGSLLLAASYCGVIGFRPTRGVVSRRGSRGLSPTLDQIGTFGRTPRDVALLCDSLAGYDASDGSSYARPKPPMLAGCQAEVPVEPCFAWLDLPFADQLSTSMYDGLTEFLDILGGRVERVPAPISLADAARCHGIVRDYEFRQFVLQMPEIPSDQRDAEMRSTLDRAGRIAEDAYEQALGTIGDAGKSFDAFFKDFDAIVAPAAFGEAPALDVSSGDVSSGAEVCSSIWTSAGLPCIALPWLTGERGLPAGVQLIGSAEEDDRLMRTVVWLESYLKTAAGSIEGQAAC
jgi:Asp-tRNA(Asn)/Glu-tRNA(Gln) amidotransferase A subunit family amidase